MPALTVGMPLYNNEATLVRALESLRRQTFDDFIVIMSDDRSTDGTASLAEQFAARDPRFRLVRQPRNLNYGNFRFVLQEARTEFFMFAAGDDWWEPTYAARCIAALREVPQAVCAVSKTAFIGEEPAAVEYARGTRPLTGPPEDNLREFLREPDDNTRMYGVFRTRAAQRAFPASDCHAYDWAFSLGTLLQGTHLEVPECLMHREKTPPHRYVEYVRRDARNVLHRIFPLLGVTSALYAWPEFRRLRVARRALLGANIASHMVYMARFHPWYHRIVEPFARRLVWRLQ